MRLSQNRRTCWGDLDSADHALNQAELIGPRSSDVISARRDLRDLQHRTQRENRRVYAMVADARAAIARHDYPAADRLLDQAEKMNARDQAVVQERAELRAAQHQVDRNNDRRVDGLVAQARTAIARHDYGKAIACWIRRHASMHAIAMCFRPARS